MPRRAFVLGAVALLAAVLLTVWILDSGGRDPNKAPPGVADHLPGSSAHGLASGARGTCNLVSQSRLKDALGGTISSPTADNLTPGMDRCTWTAAGSRLAKAPLLIVALRSELAPPVVTPSRTAHSGRKPKKTGLIAATSLDPRAVWDASSLSLSWPVKGGSLSLQIVAGHNQDVDPNGALEALEQVAQALR